MQSSDQNIELKRRLMQGCDSDCNNVNYFTSARAVPPFRSEKRPIPESQKDEKYYERRRKNNEAAKKSRDARRIREDFMALKTQILEAENSVLRRKILLLRQEIDSLQAFIIHRQKPDTSWSGQSLPASFCVSQSSCCLQNNSYPSSEVHPTALSSFMSRLSTLL